jgi:hypothetical protein
MARVAVALALVHGASGCHEPGSMPASTEAGEAPTGPSDGEPTDGSAPLAGCPPELDWGFVDGPHDVEAYTPPSGPPPFPRALTAKWRPDGIDVTFQLFDSERGHYMMRLSPDGTLLEAPRLLNTLRYPGTNHGEMGALITSCDGDTLRWALEHLDPDRSLGFDQTTALGPCWLGASSAWTSPTTFLIAWVVPGHNDGACEPLGEGSCIKVASGNIDGTISSAPLMTVGSPESHVSLFVGPDGVVLTEIRWYVSTYQSQFRFVALDAQGRATGPELLMERLPGTDENLGRYHPALMPDPDGGFIALVGGYGPSIGRMRMGADLRLVEPLTELPVFDRASAWGIYDSGMSLAPRPPGWLGLGSVITDGGGTAMLTAFDPRGNALDNLLLYPGYQEAASATDGQHTWVVYAGGSFKVGELGCIDRPE